MTAVSSIQSFGQVFGQEVIRKVGRPEQVQGWSLLSSRLKFLEHYLVQGPAVKYMQIILDKAHTY